METIMEILKVFGMLAAVIFVSALNVLGIACIYYFVKQLILIKKVNKEVDQVAENYKAAVAKNMMGGQGGPTQPGGTVN